MVTNEKTVQTEYESAFPKKKNNKGILIGIIIAAVIALAVGIGFGIYNSPENRLSRQLDLGQKYLEEQNYEQAIVAFNEAIEIDDRCLEAYVGGIEAYLHIGNNEELQVFYEKALEASRGLEGEVLTENLEYIKEIYLFATDVYSEDLNKVIEILKEGLQLTGDEEIKQALVSIYLTEAQKYMDEPDYEKAIEFYNKVLGIDEKNAEAYIGLTETYIRMGEYDKALETASKGYELTKDERLLEYINMLESGNVVRSDGKVMKRTAYDGEGAVLYYHEFTYDMQGLQDSITHYDCNHVFVSTIDLQYDEDGNWVVSYHYETESGKLTKVECSYENGLLISQKWDGEYPGWIVCEYDEKDRMIKEMHGNGTSTIVIEEMSNYCINQYDKENHRIRREWYLKEASYSTEYKLTTYWTWEYEDGEVSKYSQYDGNGTLTWYEVYDDEGAYRYDANGNLIMFTKNE